jgi:antitoxin component YwqK of YwqJK toxin-antitoxin module
MANVPDGFCSFVVQPGGANLAGVPGFEPLRYEGEYRDGKREGLWRVSTASTGAPRWQVTWSRGVWDGPASSWWPNGNKKDERHYRDGLEDGGARFWFASGRLAAEGSYKRGCKVGPWSYWDESGTPMDYDAWAERYEEWDWAYDDYTGFPHGESWPDPPAERSSASG